MNRDEVKAVVLEALREYDAEKMRILRQAQEIRWQEQINDALGIYPEGSIGWQYQQWKEKGVVPV